VDILLLIHSTPSCEEAILFVINKIEFLVVESKYSFHCKLQLAHNRWPPGIYSSIAPETLRIQLNKTQFYVQILPHIDINRTCMIMANMAHMAA
jgi:hypothetical protein